MKTSDIKRLGEAWLKVTSGESQIDEARQMKDPKKDSMVQKGGKTIVIDKSKEKEYLKKGWQLAEKKKLDPVDDKANDKKFKDRKDKDIDNDGDVDSSDEYLHKRRAATDDAIDGGKKPAKNEGKRGFIKAAKDAKEKGEKDFVFAGKKYNVESALKEEEDEAEDKPKKKNPFPPKKDGEEKDDEDKGEEESEDEDEDEKKDMPKVAGKKDDKKKVASNAKTAEISKIGEELDLTDAIKDLHKMWESAAKQQKSNATKPEEIDSKESPKSKEFSAAHKKSDKKIEDNEEDGHDKTFKAQGGTKPKSGKRPQDNQSGDTNVVKSTEAPVKGGEVKEEVELEEGAKVVDANAKEGSVSLVDMARAQLAGEIKHPDAEKQKKAYDARTKEAKAFLERMAKRRG